MIELYLHLCKHRTTSYLSQHMATKEIRRFLKSEFLEKFKHCTEYHTYFLYF